MCFMKRLGISPHIRFILMHLLACSAGAAFEQDRRRSVVSSCEFIPGKTSSVLCSGEDVSSNVPQTLPPNITRLLLSNFVMPVLESESFSKYRALTEISIKNFTRLTRIEPGTFDGLNMLRVLIIIDCMSLETIGPGVFGIFQNLDTLQIKKSGLTTVPDFSSLETESKNINKALYEIDLTANRIKSIRKGDFKNIRAHMLLLESNLLTSIEDKAFSGSSIMKLICKNNFQLRYLGDLAFSEIDGLHTLDLSRSKITYLPTDGLVNLNTLIIEDTQTLKQFPSVFKFSQISVARLTYEHHCCAFRHADKQDPVASSHMISLASPCTTQTTFAIEHSELPQFTDSTFDFRVRRSSNGFFMSSFRSLMSMGWGDFETAGSGNNANIRESADENNDKRFGFTHFNGWSLRSESESMIRGGSSLKTATAPAIKSDDNFGHFVPDSTMYTTARYKPMSTPSTIWHETPNAANETKLAICGNFSSPKDYSVVKCTPQPNAFNPCEDVMGYEWLRVFVWFVLLAALCGNLTVMIVLLTARGKLTVPKFLMCNLSFADVLMGFYLLLIASVDVHSLGEYFTYAVSWQNDGGCQVAGFLTVFSSELSVFVLTVITLERWYAISQAIYVNKRLRMRQATCLMFAGWIFALVMAVLPLFGISSYGAVSMCLPMETIDIFDKVYILALLAFNGIAFIVICGCYISMFMKVRASENMARSNDATIAKRMAILVLTNFICWAPIAFFGFTAAFGLPLIDITNSKILLVFFYPFNSCANPFLYAILTKQFRKDFFILLGRYGFCTERANKYKGTSMTRSYSNSRNNGLQLNVTHNHASDVSILSQYRKSSRGSSFSQNGTPPQGSRGSFPKVTPQSTPQETPSTSPHAVSSPSKDNPARTLFFTSASDPKTSKNERKLSTVIETSHTSDGPSDDGGICAVVSVNSEKRVLEAQDSLRDLFEGNPHGRVRSASEYVVIFKAAHSGQQQHQHQLEPHSRRSSRRSSAFQRQTSRDTILSSNTLSSCMSDASSYRRDSDIDARSMDRRLSPASFSSYEKRDSGVSDLSQENPYIKCRGKTSKLKDTQNILDTEKFFNRADNLHERRSGTFDSSEHFTRFKDGNSIIPADSIDEEEGEDTNDLGTVDIYQHVSKKYLKPSFSRKKNVGSYTSDGDDNDDDDKVCQSLLYKS